MKTKKQYCQNLCFYNLDFLIKIHIASFLFNYKVLEQLLVILNIFML